MTDGPPFSVVSLFSGAGGLDVGLDATRSFDLRACVELQASFCESLETNRVAGRFGGPGTRVIRADLSVLEPQALLHQLGLRAGQLDLLIGGPPCQAFSTAGKRQGVLDPRGTLVWDFLRFVEVMQPRFFLMENVRGLLSAALRHRSLRSRPAQGGAPLQDDEQPGSVFNLWLNDATSLLEGAYRVDVFEVNAVNYGAPQLRERVLVFGNREGKVVHFPAPTHGDESSGLVPYSTIGDALEGFHEPAPVIVDFSPRKKSFLELVPPGGNWRSLPPRVAEESMGRAYFAKGGRSGWWRRLSWDLPCPTITTLPNHASTSMCHPTETRAMSVGEFARIQEFPNGWTFAGTPAQQMTQVGNAVPARLGRVAGETLIPLLKSTEIGHPGEIPAVTRTYLRSHVRTRQWYRAGETFLWDGAGGSATYSARGVRHGQLTLDLTAEEGSLSATQVPS